MLLWYTRSYIKFTLLKLLYDSCSDPQRIPDLEEYRGDNTWLVNHGFLTF